MGGKSQWAGLTAAALTIVFPLLFTPLLEPLPPAPLDAIILTCQSPGICTHNTP